MKTKTTHMLIKVESNNNVKDERARVLDAILSTDLPDGIATIVLENEEEVVPKSKYTKLLKTYQKAYRQLLKKRKKADEK